MCGNNNTFVRMSGNNQPALDSKCHSQWSLLPGRKKKKFPCTTAETLTLNKQIINQSPLLIETESRGADISMLHPPPVPTG